MVYSSYRKEKSKPYGIFDPSIPNTFQEQVTINDDCGGSDDGGDTKEKEEKGNGKHKYWDK